MLRVLGTPTEELWPVSLSQHQPFLVTSYNIYTQGMSELPDFKKISFPDMPPIPLEEVVPDAPVEVGKTIAFINSTSADLRLSCRYFYISLSSGSQSS